MLTFMIWLLMGFILAFMNPIISRTKLPQAAVVIINGLLFGPFYFNWISFGEYERFITE